MQFEEALDYLLSLGHETLTIKLGLRNTEMLLDALGNPQENFPSLQIAGTNGKGSTAAFLSSILQAAGIRSGVFTSPHLISITERIRIGGQQISRDLFAQLTSEVRIAAETLVAQNKLETHPTFFEQVTAIALLAFRMAKIELAILETGLGGRLDATTCAQAETVAITPISLDHEEYLGNTIAEIAAEKAAIIRSGVTAVIAPQSSEIRKVILERCGLTNVTPLFDENRATVEDATRDGRFCITLETPTNAYKRVWLGLRGRHQITNVSLAVMLAEVLGAKGYAIPRAAIIRGIENAEHPGRLELVRGEPALLFDGAHNPGGALALRRYLDEFVVRPLTLVFGSMREKKLEQIAETLFPVADHLVLTEVDNPRTARLDVLELLASATVDMDRITSTECVSEAIEVAFKRTPPRGLICFTGSLYLIGEAQKCLLLEKATAK
ncbi:MAG TPA: Mur ligase family protein [Pyrinomonadaceae bacterium]|nr:Mur ligase family protein [Pyrinomonadaceae bacterium]